MFFKNRKDAAELLSKALDDYKDKNPLVIGIPRGGVEVAYYVALNLNADLSVIVAKKLPYPGHEEFAFGAVSEDNITYIRQRDHKITDELIDKTILKCNDEIQRRVNIYRDGEPLPDMKGRIVILVDDGIATGATLVPVIRFCRSKNAAKIIIATPVAGKRFDKYLHEADEIRILYQPDPYQNVGQAYISFKQLNDDEVISLLHKYKKYHVMSNVNKH